MSAQNKEIFRDDICRFRTYPHLYTNERVSCLLKRWGSRCNVKKCNPHDRMYELINLPQLYTLEAIYSIPIK